MLQEKVNVVVQIKEVWLATKKYIQLKKPIIKDEQYQP